MLKTTVLAGTATAACAAAYFLTRRRAKVEDDVEELPSIPPETVTQIFGKLCALMNANLAQIMRRLNAQGAQVPQAMLAQYLVEHFETQLRDLQTVVFKEFDVTEEDLEDAVEYYENERDASVVDAVNQLRQLYISIGGSVDIDLPPDLTVDKMCIVFEEYMKAVMEAQAAFTQHIQNLKAKGTSATATDLTEARQQKMQEKVSVVLNKHNLNTLVFQAAIEHFNDHPTFQAKVAQVKAQEGANRRA